MDFKEQFAQREEIERLEKVVEGRLKHIAYLKTSPERVSRWRKFMRILELFREVIATGTGFLAFMMTFGFVVVMLKRSGTSFDVSDYFLMTTTFTLWLNWFLDLSKEYYDRPPTKLEVD
jgi:hypothetical protein